MCHILIPVKMTIAICFLDILYVAYPDNNFIFLGICFFCGILGFDYALEGYIKSM